MPVKLKQWHYAQAPSSWHTTLTTLRLLNAHLKALCLHYNLLVINSDDPVPSLPQIHTLYNQIGASQKQYIAAKEELAIVSEEMGYFEDPDRMTWITRQDRRRYACECDEGKEEEGRRKDVELQNVTGLSEMMSGIIFESSSNGSDNDKNSEKSSDHDENNDSVSDAPIHPSTPTSFLSSFPPTPPPSPPTSTLTTKFKSKHVRFADLPPQTHRNRGVNRVCTREEVDEEFQAANTPATKNLIPQNENLRKKKRDDENWVWDWDSDQVGSVRKRMKRWHLRRWPEAYHEDV